jgi:Domain of unknown function (DUF4276)
MPRLYLFAEGQTEQTFADTVLKPHLANFGVYLNKPVLVAHAKKKGRVHRGGGRKYLPMKNDILRLLSQEKGGDVFFTTMIDLYAIHSDIPNLSEAEKLRRMPCKRVEFLEQAFTEDIGDPRFVPYIQLHEFEACLFSDPKWFAFFYDHHARQIEALETIANTHKTPELINDGPRSAPSKRMIADLPDYEGAKSVVGPQVAELIGLGTIREKCPHFAAWLSRLERLTERKS